MRIAVIALTAATLLTAACNREQSGAVGTNEGDGMPGSTRDVAAMVPNAENSATGGDDIETAGQTPPATAPGGAPQSEVSQRDRAGPSTGDSNAGPTVPVPK